MNNEDQKMDNGAADLTRREFLAGGLATGFAIAVQPVAADTITTDTTGLTAGEIRFKSFDGQEIPAYRAMPEKGDKFPVVLVVQEIFGVHEHIKDVCRRFAKQGYFAIAPELYHRQGSVADKKDFAEIRAVVSKVPDEQVMKDLDFATAYAKSTGKGDDSRLCITGFCWGGRVVWLYAAHNEKLDAGVAWYGRVVGQGTANPVDLAAKIKAPVLGLYGGKDGGIPEASLDQMREALKKAGNTKSKIVVFPEAEHGFHADYRPSYNEKAAKDGWAQLLSWFKENAKAG